LQKVQPAIPISLSSYGSAGTVNTAAHGVLCDTVRTVTVSTQGILFLVCKEHLEIH